MSTPSTEDPDTAGLTPLDDLVTFLDGLGQRHPVIRTGSRTPIPWPVRLAVMVRDGNTCSRCGAYVRNGGAELDHIVPWSAGGADDSTNLRVLCRACNQGRSNWVDVREAPRQPATWWCVACRHPEAWMALADLRVLETWHQACSEEEYSAAWEAIRQLAEPVLAFCARCDGSSYATWVL